MAKHCCGECDFYVEEKRAFGGKVCEAISGSAGGFIKQWSSDGTSQAIFTPPAEFGCSRWKRRMTNGNLASPPEGQLALLDCGGDPVGYTDPWKGGKAA